MTALFTTTIKILLQVAAGMGVMNLLDTFVKPKVGPVYYPEPVFPGIKVPKVLWFAGAFVLAILALKWVGRKMKIQILK